MTEFDPTTIPLGYTRDENGNVLTYRDSKGYWSERTYDENGWIISCRKEHSTSWDINHRVIWHYD